MTAPRRHPRGPSFAVDRPSLLLEFLIAACRGRSRTKIKSWLARRRVLVDGKPVTRFDRPLRPGQRVTVVRCGSEAGASLPPGLTIVYEDESLVVVDKPAGLLSVATDAEKERTAYRALSRYVKKESPGNKIFIVHRLDREASGLMLFAKSALVKERLQNDWRTLVRERTYLAVVEGKVEKDDGTIESRIGENKAMTMYIARGGEGKPAVTRFRVLKRNAGYSLLEVALETGRKNQIRVHMEELGHCIAGDKKYGAKTNPVKRLCLHAHKLGFTHPVTEEKLEFTSPMPGSFKRLF
ncbi:MAG: RluA family pseudouridine synthase [Spirochaetales bacterium]|nr:RluA family pseudouridine synthase [Spirochaetales bacterium]